MPAIDKEFPVLLLNDLHKTYNPGSPLQVHVLKGISLAVERGDYVAIMGHSGSGKSTMLNILGCLDIPTSGSYLIDGTSARFVANVVRQTFPNVQDAGNGTFLLVAFEASW